MKPIINIATQVVRHTGRLLARQFDLRDSDKSPQEFLQQARLQAEAKIIDDIQRTYPRHHIVLPSQTIAGQGDFTWHIDVIDGDMNYCHQLPHFATVITIEEQGRVEHALIHDPLLDETFIATRGMQSKMNSQRLRIANTNDLSGALIAGELAGHADIRNTGCHSLMLAYVAAGRLDAYRGRNLSAIALQAGSLLVKTAGGLYSDWQGGNDYLPKAELLAANPKLFKQLLSN